ncbi:cytochrome P450 [Microbispora sp. NPDC049125]|uniref:cytochrome P450 n=1 Tax=Microbispora sp. NPDC049125 TaxID=3154929 RepID=UPI00346696CB
MTTTESELGAQLRTARAALKSLGAVGDHYARLLLGPDDPYPIYARMRRRGPLQVSRLGSFVVVSHDLADKVLRDRRLGLRRTDGERPVRGFSDFDNSLLGLDPPDHTRLRALAAPSFSPRAIAGFRADVERACDSLLDKVTAGGFDLMRDYASHIPVAVIGDLFGIPEEHRPRFNHLAAGLSLVLDGVVSLEEATRLQEAVTGMRELFTELLALRRTEPGADFVSGMLGPLGDDKLTADELVAMCGMLALAGTETTVNLIGNGTLALLEHPDQWAALRADPDLAPRAVEETLRYDASVLMQTRVAHEDLELMGKRVPADTQVVLLTGACNRDPDAFPDPDRFDITREPGASHISFSSGIHYCLGAPLARLEGDVALRRLVSRFPGLRRTGPVVRRSSPFIRGLRALPVAG